MSDLRNAFRQIARAPGHAAVAVLIVAIGIGAASAIFSVVNGVVLRPLALPEPNRLVAVYETNFARHLPAFAVSAPNYTSWRDRSQSWESIAAVGWQSMNLSGTGEPEVVPVRAVTANFLPTLGLPTVLGRNFLEEEDRPGGRRVAIINDSFWQRHFNRKPDVIGETLTFDQVPYTVVGVLGADAVLPGWRFEVLVPLALDGAQTDRSLNHELEVYGRLKRGITLALADVEMKALAERLYAESSPSDHGWSTRLVPFDREIVGDSVRLALFVLLGAVGLLLLVACANLSNLLLLRASSRAHELAIRTALGASRWRVIRQVVTEALVITAIGGLGGIVIAVWAVDAMQALPLPRIAEISIDIRVLAAACGVTALTGLFAGLGPALRASQARPQEALKGRAPRSGHRSRIRQAMIVAQLALSLMLLVGAALLGRSFIRLMHVDPGFTTENVLTLVLRPQMENAAAFYDEVVRRVSALPEVAAAGIVSALPLTEGNTSNPVAPVGPSPLPDDQSVQANWRLVDGDYFGALRIPVLRGRTFAGLPADIARGSVVLSASLARALFGDADPVGREIRSTDRDVLKVIGVVGDVRTARLGIPPSPTFYWSTHRFTYGPQSLVIRTRGDTAPLVASIRATIRSIDATVPVFRLRTFAQVRATSLEQERLLLGLFGAFAAVALLLAGLGTYGVMAFMVQQRTHEIGVRLAIGAQQHAVMGLVLRQGARLLAFGGALGLLASWGAARVLASVLYDISISDAVSYLAAFAALSLAALAASLLPAHRATQVDPVEALRGE